jgi:hypothetical protein
MVLSLNLDLKIEFALVLDKNNKKTENVKRFGREKHTPKIKNRPLSETGLTLVIHTMLKRDKIIQDKIMANSLPTLSTPAWRI